jgi:hypothetical protein
MLQVGAAGIEEEDSRRLISYSLRRCPYTASNGTMIHELKRICKEDGVV